MLFALGGCAVGPDFKRPKVKIAPNWSTADPRIQTRTATDAMWWASFEDPVLNQLVEEAYQQNLPLQVAGLRIVEARAQLGIATGEIFPQTQAVAGKVTATGLSKEAANVQNL